jgi:uncharacterized protein (TIGR03435 family)
MRLVWCFAILAAAVSAQQPSTAAFEVASIKVSTEPPGSSSWNSRTGTLWMRNVTLKYCIQAAYSVKDFQISGGPKWIEEDRYNIDAKADGPAKDPELMAMLQTLLADRFHLSLHRETKPFPGYALVVAKGGLKIKPDEAEGGGTSRTNRDSMEIQRRSMDSVATALSRLLGTQVVDATGLAGKFSLNIKWTPEENRSMSAASAESQAPLLNASAGPSLPAVLEDQLGLRLEARKVPTEVLVIDRAEKPAEN